MLKIAVFLLLMCNKRLIMKWAKLGSCESCNCKNNHSPAIKKKTNTSFTTRDGDDKQVLKINSKAAVVFVIAASTFLVLLFFFMTAWFMWVLIILFCISSVQGMHNCITSLTLRKWPWISPASISTCH